MAKCLTQLKAWYLKLDQDQRKQMRQLYNDLTGASQKTFYTHLLKEPSKLFKQTLSTLSSININDLYKEV